MKHIVEGIRVTCENHLGGYTFYIPIQSVYIYARVRPCELCGEHGDVTLEVDCPQCRKQVRIKIKEW